MPAMVLKFCKNGIVEIELQKQLKGWGQNLEHKKGLKEWDGIWSTTQYLFVLSPTNLQLSLDSLFSQYWVTTLITSFQLSLFSSLCESRAQLRSTTKYNINYKAWELEHVVKYPTTVIEEALVKLNIYYSPTGEFNAWR